MRIVTLSRDSSSDWISCDKIAAGLSFAYQELASRLDAQFIPMALTQSSNWTGAPLTKDDLIAIIDHRLTPSELRPFFDTPIGRQAQIHFHIYGSFTIHLNRWLSLATSLRGLRIKWIAGSQAQAGLVSELIVPSASTYVAPFAAPTTEFSYSPQERIRWRSRLGVRTNEFLFVYAGRLYREKNISLTIELLHKLLKKFGINFKLALAGSWDDTDSRLFGTPPLLGAEFQHLQTCVTQLSQCDRQRIQFTGPLNAADLNGLLNAGDAFISLSLHHDEDFGMAAAEAALTGSPLLLTNWGGFRYFETVSPDSLFLPVSLRENSLRIECNLKQISDWTRQQWTSGPRARRSQVAKRVLSAKTLANHLGQIHQNQSGPFLGYTSSAQQLSQRISSGPVFGEGPSSHGLYAQLYQHYLFQGTKTLVGDLQFDFDKAYLYKQKQFTTWNQIAPEKLRWLPLSRPFWGSHFDWTMEQMSFVETSASIGSKLRSHHRDRLLVFFANSAPQAWPQSLIRFIKEQPSLTVIGIQVPIFRQESQESRLPFCLHKEVGLKDLFTEHDLSGAYYWIHTDYPFASYTFLDHWLCSAGARPFQIPSPSQKGASLIPLSPFHSLRVTGSIRPQRASRTMDSNAPPIKEVAGTF